MSKHAVSDQDGRFRFRGVPPGVVAGLRIDETRAYNPPIALGPYLREEHEAEVSEEGSADPVTIELERGADLVLRQVLVPTSVWLGKRRLRLSYRGASCFATSYELDSRDGKTVRAVYTYRNLPVSSSFEVSCFDPREVVTFDLHEGSNELIVKQGVVRVIR